MALTKQLRQFAWSDDVNQVKAAMAPVSGHGRLFLLFL